MTLFSSDLASFCSDFCPRFVFDNGPLSLDDSVSTPRTAPACFFTHCLYSLYSAWAGGPAHFKFHLFGGQHADWSSRGQRLAPAYPAIASAPAGGPCGAPYFLSASGSGTAVSAYPDGASTGDAGRETVVTPMRLDFPRGNKHQASFSLSVEMLPSETRSPPRAVAAEGSEARHGQDNCAMTRCAGGGGCTELYPPCTASTFVARLCNELARLSKFIEG